MRRLLVLGAGPSAGYLIECLLSRVTVEEWCATVGDGETGTGRKEAL